MTDDTGPAPWERQPGETDAQYRAFRAYLDLGDDRTLAKTYQAVYGRPYHGKGAPRFIEQWSSTNRWAKRAAAHLDFTLAEEDRLRSEEIRREARTWARRQMQQRRDEWELRDRLLKRAHDVLELTIASFEKISLKDAVSLAEAASKLGRLASELPVNVQGLEHTGKDGAPLATGQVIVYLPDNGRAPEESDD